MLFAANDKNPEGAVILLLIIGGFLFVKAYLWWSERQEMAELRKRSPDAWARMMEMKHEKERMKHERKKMATGIGMTAARWLLKR